MRASTTSSTLTVQPLGSGREVGRSCHLLKFKGKTVLLDAGIHPGKSGMAALPFFDLVDDLASIDILLISHFHLDHVACLPYLTQKTKFKGRIFMTHPTFAVTKLLLLDYVRVSGVQRQGRGEMQEETLFDDKDITNCLAKVDKIDFHQQMDVDGIRFTAYNAGHVLGACQYLIEISGVRILYTGDFSREDDRHLMGAECNPDWRPDVLIVESTFGVQVHEPQRERERQFVEAIDRITRRGGKCLIPVFSLGRAQELLLILEDYWNKNPELQQIPIYHASRLAAMSLSIFRRFINSMNDNIRAQNAVSNPWELQHISNLENPNDFDEPGPAVVLASPGMLQNGTSRRLFEQWCSDPRNGVIIAGYCVEGTLAKDILSEPKEITALSGRKLPLACEIRLVSFTAHSDYPGTSSYIRQLKPRYTVLVHGEQTEMERLFHQLKRSFEEDRNSMDFFMPENGGVMRFVFNEERVIKMLGSLADKRSRQEGARVAGLLVSGDFDDRLVAPKELEMFTQLSSTVVWQRLHVPFHSRFSRLKAFVGKLFTVKVVSETQPGAQPSAGQTQKNSLLVMDEITLTHTYPPGSVLMEWAASPAADCIADAIVALLMQAEGGVSGIRISSCFHHEHDLEESVHEDVHDDADGPRSTAQVASFVKIVLEERYGAEHVTVEGTSVVLVTEEGVRLTVDSESLAVTCDDDDDAVRSDVDRLVSNCKRALLPLTVERAQPAKGEEAVEQGNEEVVEDE